MVTLLSCGGFIYIAAHVIYFYVPATLTVPEKSPLVAYIRKADHTFIKVKQGQSVTYHPLLGEELVQFNYKYTQTTFFTEEEPYTFPVTDTINCVVGDIPHFRNAVSKEFLSIFRKRVADAGNVDLYYLNNTLFGGNTLDLYGFTLSYNTETPA